ncbi:class I SAM-dependent methyltransferase [Arenibaculum sp.]|jgi:SAM-dependent methyltransferase|uniref:class I SAM-dependent methyltransferase n=1 Tax=Arenibaculum sp. TaxID=2865862 RepID=UPI002E132259|nr:class I SAM-dependent methyltransferase [Arenibaculum sp.]
MSGKQPDREHWSEVAAEWMRWARTPDHDAFWAYRDGLRAFIGSRAADALDVGCGEGRVSRELRALGYDVTAADVVEALAGAAKEAGSAHRHVVADAAALPFADRSFDLVVAYNVLMDVADVPAAVAEVARVLRPAGELMVSLVHPFRDRGSFDGEGPDAPFVLKDTYYGRKRFEGAEERDGLRMRYAGWSMPLESYAAALERAGLAITALREPLPADGARQQHAERWKRIPLFLWLKARPVA